MKIDLKHLRAFVAVADNLHFSKAADAIYVSQPTLTLLIQQLETAVGAPLISRTTRSVSLTEMGDTLLPTAREISGDLESAIMSIRDLVELRRGRLTIAALPSLAANIMPRAIRVFLDRYPEIKLRLLDVITDDLVNAVLTGEADFGIGYLPNEERGISLEPLIEDEILILVPKGHRLAKRSELPWRRLTKEPLIALPVETSVRKLIDNELAKGGHRLKPIMEPTHMSTIVSLVAQGVAVGVLPSSFVRSASLPDVVSVAATNPIIRRPLGLLFKKNKVLSPAGQEMRNIIFELRSQGL